MGGTFDVKLFVDRSGVLVSEVDTVTRGSITWANPANGGSAWEPMTGTSHAECPDGIAVGKRAVVEITGHAFDTGDIVAISGNFASATVRVCDALT